MPKEKSASEYPFYDIPSPIAIVHRGGDAAGAEKENSMAAFDSAYQRGIVYGETDTVATRDNVALALHGAKNEKQAQKWGLPTRDEIQATTYADVLRNVRVGGEVIPTLEEVLVTFPEMRFFIDPKTEESVKPLADLINKLHVQDRVSIGAFSYDRTKAVAELAGGQRDVCTSLDAVGALALLGTGLRLPNAKKYLEGTQATSLQIGPESATNALVTKNMIERAHDLGIHVIIWTPNTEATIARALDKGVHGVMSDRTELMKSIVLSRDPDNRSIHRNI
ncbi:MAG TPA: glycerophosphodiester phosphodiesterase family protein [Candidatus Saccharimonadales bacterium]|nr:glycerophosphodiester phosphodiesterase family protein [Candidatus Saccharimonadales bacterium]